LGRVSSPAAHSGTRIDVVIEDVVSIMTEEAAPA
jgi:hypothetical protein